MKSMYDNLTPAHILTQVKADSHEELFRILADAASGLPEVWNCHVSRETIFNALTEREAQSPTTLGGGSFFPHARLRDLQRAGVIVATLAQPLPVPAPDDCPVDIVCCVLIPEEQPMAGLKFIAGIAQALRKPETRIALKGAPDAETFLAELRALHLKAPESLTVAAFMAPCAAFAGPEWELPRATRLMADQHLETIPVLDGGRVVGQLNCFELFKLGIPDFFSQLKSVGFIRYFDPFENYFSVQAKSLVRDVMTRDFCAFTVDATLIEVVFAISVQKYPQIYVVEEDNRLLGVIDQAVLLERILNL